MSGDSWKVMLVLTIVLCLPLSFVAQGLSKPDDNYTYQEIDNGNDRSEPSQLSQSTEVTEQPVLTTLSTDKLEEVATTMLASSDWSLTSTQASTTSVTIATTEQPAESTSPETTSASPSNPPVPPTTPSQPPPHINPPHSEGNVDE